MRRLLVLLLLTGCGAGASTVAPSPIPPPVVVAPSPISLDMASPTPVASPSRASRTRASAAPAVRLPRILIVIRGCESGHDYRATNPRSTASGAYQFLDSTWRYVTGLPGRAKDYSRRVQDAAALRLYRSEGTTPWLASKGCWG